MSTQDKIVRPNGAEWDTVKFACPKCGSTDSFQFHMIDDEQHFIMRCNAETGEVHRVGGGLYYKVCGWQSERYTHLPSDVEAPEWPFEPVVDDTQTFEVLVPIDDDSQRAELQEALTFEINRIMGDYNKEVIRTVNMMKTDDQEAVDRQTARLEKKKAETQKALEFYCGGDYIEGVNVHEELHQPAMAGLMTRLSAIGSEGINTSRLTNLVNFDESISS